MIVMKSLRVGRLAACLSSALVMLGLANSANAAHTYAVANCLDNGGSQTLRGAAALAVSGDTINMSSLTCNDINLSKVSGQIAVASGVTIAGRPTDLITVHADFSRVFAAYGVGTLTINNLAMDNGYAYNPNGSVSGGCVNAADRLVMLNVSLSNCVAIAGAGDARGGALAVGGHADLSFVNVVNSTVSGLDGAHGGAIDARSVYLTYATLRGNLAQANSGSASAQGGAVTVVDRFISNSSTFAGNSAGEGGAISHIADPADLKDSTVNISNSTFSGNSASATGGAILRRCGCANSFNINNSTFAYNTADMVVGGIYSDSSIEAHSSIFANDRLSNGTSVDVYISDNAAQFTGTNNLLIGSNFTVAPTVVVSRANPRLTPLDFHGAPYHAPTHGLSVNSPAIAAGDNLSNADYDERGNDNLGAFHRTNQTTHLTDIGAFERQPDDDQLFYGGFL